MMICPIILLPPAITAPRIEAFFTGYITRNMIKTDLRHGLSRGGPFRFFYRVSSGLPLIGRSSCAQRGGIKILFETNSIQILKIAHRPRFSFGDLNALNSSRATKTALKLLAITRPSAHVLGKN
jgi:hypothetical protein